MDEQKLNVGIIGYGWAATAHIDAINATGRGNVTAVYSSRELSGAELSAKHGGSIRTYARLAQLLEDPSIDVVSVTSYPGQHRDQVIAAARAGKHLIIEKPLAMTLEDARAMRDEVARSGVQACVCFEVRFSSQFQTTRALIDDGLLGELHYGEVDYYHGIGPWYGQYRWNTTRENGGSSLLSAGCHAMDALLLCMGDGVEEVTSYTTQSANSIFAKYEYPTTSTTIVKFSSGKVGKCASVIDCLQPYYFRTHLIGSEGSLLDNKLYSEKLHLRDKTWTELPIALTDSGDVADHPYREQFQVFFDSIQRSQPMPLAGLDEAFRSFEVVFAADKSAAEGRPVKLSELRA